MRRLRHAFKVAANKDSLIYAVLLQTNQTNLQLLFLANSRTNIDLESKVLHYMLHM